MTHDNSVQNHNHNHNLSAVPQSSSHMANGFPVTTSTPAPPSPHHLHHNKSNGVHFVNKLAPPSPPTDLPTSPSVSHPDPFPKPTVPVIPYAQRVSRIASAARTILDCLGENADRPGLQDTPERYAKALLALTEGYAQTPRSIVKDALFPEDDSQLVLVQQIDVFSLCEHHLLPFHGHCHVAYIPNGAVIGLSKIARIVDMYARRLQVQERLTTQVADAIQSVTNAAGVMVYVSCAHMCMSMRGVRKVGASTVTTATRGRYSSEPSLRSEFLAMIDS